MSVAVFVSTIVGLVAANALNSASPGDCSEVPPFAVTFALNEQGQIEGPVSAGGAENSSVDHIRNAAQEAIAQVRATPTYSKAGAGVHGRTVRMKFSGVSCDAVRTVLSPPEASALTSPLMAHTFQVLSPTASPSPASATPTAELSAVPPPASDGPSKLSRTDAVNSERATGGKNPVKLSSYKGADAGRIVVSRVSRSTYAMYSFDPPILCIRRVGSGDWTFLGRNADASFSAFDLDLKRITKSSLIGGTPPPVGAVGVTRLAPGQYELYRVTFSPADCDLGRRLMAFERPLSFKAAPLLQDYAVPFEIKAGRTLYFGSISAVAIPGRVGIGFFHTSVPVDMYLTDESSRDLDRARKRWPDIQEYDVEVFDADTLGVPHLRRTLWTGS